MKGAYVLLIKLTEDRNLRIGALGEFFFPAGFYVYTGSSMTNLKKRVRRHFSIRKETRWHIDYLLREAEVYQAILFPSEDREECKVNEMVFDKSERIIVAKGFGSSDCSCKTHLAYFGKNQPHLEYPHERQTMHPPS